MPFSTSVLSFCPVSITLFLGTAALFTFYQKQRNLTTTTTTSTSTATTATTTTTVVFVLGGPGAGKGTLCQLLSQRLGWIHLSAGDLLRAERIQKGPSAALIEQRISAGQLVPSEITVALLLAAMVGHEKVLVDGFPRSQENVDAWNDAILQKNNNNNNIIVKLVLNLVCPEEVLVGRLLERGRTSGRQDDELSVIRKRFQTFQQESKPIVDLYKDKLVTIETDVAVEQVYNAIKPHVEYL